MTEKRIKPSRVLLIGFSQGTMMILETLMSRTKGFLGLIGFSGGFLDFSREMELGSIQTPILLVHGDADPVVPANMTDMAVKTLRQKGFRVEKHICNGLGHGISMDGLSHASEFLKKLLKEEMD